MPSWAATCERRWRLTGPAGPTDLPPAAQEPRPSDPSTGTTLLELALLVGILVVIVVLAVVAVIVGGPNP